MLCRKAWKVCYQGEQESSRPGQPKELGEASDDEFVEVKENTIEDMEHCESREEDEDLEEVGQEELEVSGDYVHLPDAPRVRAVQS